MHFSNGIVCCHDTSSDAQMGQINLERIRDAAQNIVEQRLSMYKEPDVEQAKGSVSYELSRKQLCEKFIPHKQDASLPLKMPARHVRIGAEVRRQQVLPCDQLTIQLNRHGQKVW